MSRKTQLWLLLSLAFTMLCSGCNFAPSLEELRAYREQKQKESDAYNAEMAKGRNNVLPNPTGPD
jgi:hypothetical protein